MDWIKHYPVVYESIAGSYHQLRFSNQRGQYDLYESLQALYHLLATFHLEPRTLQVLDVACGTGKMSIPLAQAGADVTSLDASPGMLQQVCQRAAQFQVQQRIHPQLASADRLPYPAGRFDVVLSSRFLHLFPLSLYPLFVNEMLRVVKPGGYVVVEIKNKDYGLVINRYRDRQKRLQGKPPSSAMRINEIHHLQEKLVQGKIVKILGCQLPKAQLFPSTGKTAALLRGLSGTLLSPIAYVYFVAIQKNET